MSLKNEMNPELSDCKNFRRFEFHKFNAGSGLIVFLPITLEETFPRDFWIATFDGINQACRYGDT